MKKADLDKTSCGLLVELFSVDSVQSPPSNCGPRSPECGYQLPPSNCGPGFDSQGLTTSGMGEKNRTCKCANFSLYVEKKAILNLFSRGVVSSVRAFKHIAPRDVALKKFRDLIFLEKMNRRQLQKNNWYEQTLGSLSELQRHCTPCIARRML